MTIINICKMLNENEKKEYNKCIDTLTQYKNKDIPHDIFNKQCGNTWFIQEKFGDKISSFRLSDVYSNIIKGYPKFRLVIAGNIHINEDLTVITTERFYDNFWENYKNKHFTRCYGNLENDKYPQEFKQCYIGFSSDNPIHSLR